MTAAVELLKLYFSYSLTLLPIPTAPLYDQSTVVHDHLNKAEQLSALQCCLHMFFVFQNQLR